MKYFFFFLATLLALNAAPNQSLAQQNGAASGSPPILVEVPPANPAAALEPANDQPKPLTTNTEVVELRAQLAVVRDYQDRFIGVVLWSLGAVVTMTIGLLAFGWFTNKVNYERDRDSVRQERDNLRSELRSFISDEIRRVSQDVSSTLNDREKLIEQRVERTAVAHVQRVTSQLKDLAGRVHDIEHENLERDATRAAKEKRYGWAIYKYCQLLDSSVRRESDSYEVPDILDAIKAMLTTPGVKTSADDVTELATALNKLPNKYHAAAETVIRLAKGLQ